MCRGPANNLSHRGSLWLRPAGDVRVEAVLRVCTIWLGARVNLVCTVLALLSEPSWRPTPARRAGAVGGGVGAMPRGSGRRTLLCSRR
jgi:hypothetical protein